MAPYHLHCHLSDWNTNLICDKEVFIQRIKYVSQRGLVDLYDHQKHLSEEESSPSAKDSGRHKRFKRN